MTPTPDGRSSRVRLQDVADASGVAVSTVSRAFTDPSKVGAATLELVHETSERLGYRPALGRARGHAIAVMVQDTTNPYLAALTSAIEHQLRPAGYSMTLAMTEESAELERAHVRRQLPTGDGQIVAPRHLADDELRRLAAAAPTVLFNREVEGVSSVVIDTSAGTRQIIEHLASLGHTRVVYAAGPEHSWSERQRWAVLSEAATASGISLDRIGPYLPTLSQGAVAADAALARTPTAVVAFNDQIAIGLMNRARMLGVALPEQLSIIGYDDTFGSDFCQPPLTTVAGPVERAGRLAVDTLLGMLDGTPAGTQHRIEGTLVLRQSTASV